ncbi:MAG: CvpA family protein [Rhizomicrobium sp.]|jgi:membrane protein required for colicin V production
MGHLNFSFVDVLVVLVVLASVIYATYRGFVQETLTIFAWAAAAFATLYFGPALAPFLRQRISPEWLGTLVAYGGIFLVVLIPLSFVSFRFAQGVKRSPVGAVDRALGFSFGFIRGLAIVGIAYLAFCMVVPIRTQPDWMTNARFLPLIQGSSDVLLSLIPDQHIQTANSGGTPAPPGTPIPKPAPRQAQKGVKHGQKAYGAEDRRALDRLIQSTGNGDAGKP